ncbi:MAG: hypothetical protein V3V18_11080 [Methylococcales bacterium]
MKRHCHSEQPVKLDACNTTMTTVIFNPMFDSRYAVNYHAI